MTRSTTTLEITPLPKHVAIIMDGNGRWAQQRNLPRLAGHRAGTENIRKVVQGFAQYNIKHLSLYAFSTENWARPKEEVWGLLRILASVINRETKALHKEGVKIQHIGRLDRLPKRIQNAVVRAVELTRNNTRMNLNMAFDYGGRAEIIDAVKHIVKEGIPPEQIDERLLGHYLYTNGMPDPDLIIRTAGEMRLSNFLIWQTAYSEYYFTPTLWPDLDMKEIEKALLAYSHRQRRFGGL